MVIKTLLFLHMRKGSMLFCSNNNSKLEHTASPMLENMLNAVDLEGLLCVLIESIADCE